MGCFTSTIAVSHAHWTFQIENFILKVVFIFQNFLVITVAAMNKPLKN